MFFSGLMNRMGRRGLFGRNCLFPKFSGRKAVHHVDRHTENTGRRKPGYPEFSEWTRVTAFRNDARYGSLQLFVFNSSDTLWQTFVKICHRVSVNELIFNK